MSRRVVGAALAAALTGLLALAGCSKGSPFEAEIQAIYFETESLPSGGAGEFYNQIISFGTEGGAAPPDRFELESGVLPPGLTLMRDREDLDADGIPDQYGAFTGNARLLGYPREAKSYTFSIQAISTGAMANVAQALDQPDLAVTADFTILIGEGAVNILTPTAQEGTSDPAVPAFPDVIDFVNPANPDAFFSFPFLVAGGSGNNLLNVYLPRELELSVFDAAVVNGSVGLDADIDESASSGDKYENDFVDGGVFVLQAGNGKVQIGGFQSPRGVVGKITSPDPDWFQRALVPFNSRRDLADTEGLAAGDTTLGTDQPVRFSDYFDANYEGTHPSFTAPPGSGLQRRKYPFVAGEYLNAFFMPFTQGVHLTPLRFRAIVEAIDTRGTPDKADDRIARKAYAIQVRIPSINIDTVVLPAGQAGVDYNEFVNASGGVPPLQFDLEWVDGTQDLAVTTGDPLDRDLFGLELDAGTGQFFGVPRASSEIAGAVELTVRVFAAVMNPTQDGAALVPTGNPGEFDGRHPVTGRTGRHKTLPVFIAGPTLPAVANTTLAPGVDGLPYPGDRIRGTGGVPRLVPYPVGFTGTYPSATAARNYEWDASYRRDASYGTGAGTAAPGLPNALQLEGDPLAPDNGEISGTTYDRGFHPVTINGIDAYVGDAGSPDAAAFRKSFQKDLALSVSPDSAVYMRGVPKSQGGVDSGLLDDTAQMTEPLMVPMFLAAGLYTVASSEQPQLFGGSNGPKKADILPVMLCNGGSDAHVEKSIPSVSGFWPAESGKLDEWPYYYYGAPNAGWKHLQQEFCWLQTPGASQRRVFLWADTKIKKWISGATSGYGSKRYQQYDRNGRRGVLVLDPLTGEFWAPAVLSNNNSAHGSQFGAEFVLGTGATQPNYSYYGYVYSGYWRYYNYAQYTMGDREVHLQGLGSYLESYEQSSSGRQTQGRTATSVAMSADGTWCATALPGGSEQKILLWRTDKQPIPAAILAQPFVTGVDGIDADGSTLSNSACIFNLGGEYASGKYISTNQRYLLPDSLKFVRDGLVFLMERHLDYVFGLSLVDGHLSARYLNSRSQVTSGQGTGYTVNSTDGQYIPDQDYLRGMKQSSDFSVQFAFAGNKPAPGEEGPDKLAFVAGDNYSLRAFADYSGSYVDLPDQAREGYAMAGNRNKSLLFLETSTSPGAGLDLNSSTLKDLTGSDSRIYGDLLTPGRPGEELDFLSVSDDGKYAAVVRDLYPYYEYTYYYYSYVPSWGTPTTSSTYSYYVATDDVMICSTTGEDLDTASGTQTVLYLGSGNYSAGYTGTPSADSVSYASARAYLNAKGRRINGIRFAPDNRTLLLTYAGDNSYWTKYMGGSIQYGINASSRQSSTYKGLSAQITLRVHFRTAAGGAINFANDASNFMKNNLQGLTASGVSGIGDTSAPFTVTNNDSEQQFWATFRSHSGNFLYFVVDQINGRNYLVGFNMSTATINGHAPWVPFSPHAATIGFEQFDTNSWNYENRFASVPGGVVYPPSGRDGAGIVFIIGNDASAGVTNPVDLEVYAFDADLGGDLVALTSDVTTGTTNAINHLYASADGNFLVGQICRTSSSSNTSRTALYGQTDLFAVTNVHAALAGSPPDDFVISSQMSHGTTVAFVGENTSTGPQAIVYSSAPKGGGQTWDDRTLKLAVLAPGAVPEVLDATPSHYVVLAGTRKLDDDPLGPD